MKIIHEFLSVLAQPMALVGVFGQLMFSARFLVQWIVSEKRGQSVMPVAFWYLSLGGGLLVLVYAIWRRDLVFTVAQMCGLVVYARNLVLIRRKRTG